MSELTLAERMTLMETTLERAAEAVGDLTRPVRDRFYRRYPEAAASFHELGLGEPGPLEARMIESALFCLMHWLEESTVVKTLVDVYLPHHCITLNVREEWFQGMVEETADIVMETIPPEQAAEQAVWGEIRAGLIAAIADAASAPDMVRLNALGESARLPA